MEAQLPKISIFVEFDLAIGEETLTNPHLNNLFQYIKNNDNDLRNNYLLVSTFIEWLWEFDDSVDDRDKWGILDLIILAIAKEMSPEDYQAFLLFMTYESFPETICQITQNTCYKSDGLRFLVNGKLVPLDFSTPTKDFIRYENIMIADVDGKTKAIFFASMSKSATEIYSQIEKAEEFARKRNLVLNAVVIELLVTSDKEYEEKTSKIKTFSAYTFPGLELEFQKSLVRYK